MSGVGAKILIPKAVPWSSWEEWELVYNNIWSGDVIRQVFALEVIGMWKCRGRLPTAIESTALLTEAVIRDQQGVSYSASIDPSARSALEMRSLYCSAIVRSVNNIVDPAQKGVYAESIYQIATRIGLPGWIVELRHEATHDNIPSLNLLRSGAKHLLSWYNSNYWTPQHTYITDLSVGCLPDPINDADTQSNAGDASAQNVSIQNFVSPTFLSGVFMPIVVESVLLPSQESSTDRTSEGYRSQAENILSIWTSLIDEFETFLPSFGHHLTCRLMVAILDTEKRVKNQNVELGVEVVSLWIDRMTAPKSQTKSLYQRKLESNLSDAIMCRIDSLIDSHSEFTPELSLMKSKLKAMHSINSVKVSESDALGKRANAEEINTEKRLKHSSEVSSASGIKKVLLPVWPLGLLPGCSSTGNLHLIQERHTSSKV